MGKRANSRKNGFINEKDTRAHSGWPHVVLSRCDHQSVTKYIVDAPTTLHRHNISVISGLGFTIYANFEFSGTF